MAQRAFVGQFPRDGDRSALYVLPLRHCVWGSLRQRVSQQCTNVRILGIALQRPMQLIKPRRPLPQPQQRHGIVHLDSGVLRVQARRLTVLLRCGTP